MKPSPQIVISASRRTDIPAFYMDWFINQIDKGFFDVINPYNRKKSRIAATPDNVHTLVFWSKNFAPFIKGGFGQKLLSMGYNLFFNFTINSNSSLLEPRVPPLTQRLDQIEALCRNFGAGAVNWRFDPICFFKFHEKEVQDNLNDFTRIAARACQCGVTRCITSFMDHYPKIKKRIACLPKFSFVDPPLKTKKAILMKMENVLNALPSDSNIKKSSCIPNDLLVKIFGGNLSFKKDTGQRVTHGCGCMVSVDIGSYHLHPCYHNCLFCYANPTSQKKLPIK